MALGPMPYDPYDPFICLIAPCLMIPMIPSYRNDSGQVQEDLLEVIEVEGPPLSLVGSCPPDFVPGPLVDHLQLFPS
jgi:hypothetical protein